MDISAAIECLQGQWAPGIGDPSVLGWSISAAYGVTAVLALAAAYRRNGDGARWFWFLSAVILAALAFNKQLDLQSALTAFGRCLAEDSGWREDRRAVQFGFIALLAGALTSIGALLLWALWSELRHVGLALLGMACLAGFLVGRAARFHHAGDLLSFLPASPMTISLLEYLGIGLIGLNALWRIASAGARHAQTPKARPK